MKSIFDRSFRYVSSAETDLHKTFARERRRLREAAEAKAQAAPKLVTVSDIKQRAQGGSK